MAQEANQTNKFSSDKFNEVRALIGEKVKDKGNIVPIDSYRKNIKQIADKLQPLIAACKTAVLLREEERRVEEEARTKAELEAKEKAEQEAKEKAQQEAIIKAQQEAKARAAQPQGGQKPQQSNQKEIKVKTFGTAQPQPRPSYVKGKAAVIYTDFEKAKKPQGGTKPAKDFKKQGTQQTAQASGQAKKPQERTITEIPQNIPVTQPGKRTKDKTKESSKNFEDKAPMTKRKLIRKGYIDETPDEDRVRVRKLKGKKKQEVIAEHKPVEHVVVTSERLSVKELSEKMGVSIAEIMKSMLEMGGTPVTSVNDTVDRDTMIIVADSFGVNLEYKIEQSLEEKAEEMHEVEDSAEELVERPPVITVMGHVDHGKTSLLDAIRKANVAAGEAGGITQHIGAYSVSWDYDGRKRKITFLDTPGHEAFTEMRARGAKATDIVVLVVAADDGIQPQTIEAINHIKAANCPMIVAMNKIDKEDANTEKLKQDLAAHGVVPDEWGGDVKMVPISAKKRIGIDTLLEEILFLADYLELKANPERQAKGVIIEAGIDTGRGPVATMLVQNGTLSKNDAVVCGTVYGKVRTMTDWSGKPVKTAGPSSAVVITGLSGSPVAGDGIWVVESEKVAKEIAEGRIEKERYLKAGDVATQSFTTETQKTLNVLIKTDVMGSCEALVSTISKMENEEVKVHVVHSGVGTITKSDMMLAEVSKAMVIGFNVKPDAEARQIAEQSGISVGSYRVIYDAIDAVEARMNGMTAPKFEEVYLGKVEVRKVFGVSGKVNIAGSYVLDGKIVRSAKVIVKRGDKTIAEDTIAGLKHFKDDVKEVATGFECGITLNKFDAFEEGDIIEAYTEQRV